MTKTKRKELEYRRKLLLVIVAIAILVVAGLGYVLLKGNEMASTKNSPSPSPNPSASSEAKASVAPGHSLNPGTGNTPGTPTPTPTPVTSMPAPTGDLYSQKPPVSLTANPLEESVCNTLPGATCDIVLVSPSGQQVSFAAPATDTTGGHIVDWYLKKYIGGAGDWKIFSRASLNGQTNTSPQYDFEVNP